ncbi:Cof-type HAD-IIB family hydrolase [Kluyvera sp. STS39-E]|uniref:Cof-type HAD-IIB family hydrolase n=1 Tax=Kluyvera sp. STS39-E TaxID=3234748 RepID=UPI0034C677C4
MSVKLIAVDMDGTFLNDKKTYNRERFLQQYQQMKQRQIRFVVASGNQYYQLASFFPEIVEEIAFVAENGGWVRDAGEDIYNCSMPRDHFQQIVNFLLTRPEIEIIACGKASAYTLKSYTPRFHEIAQHYYHRIELVDNFDNIDDTILKFALNIPDEKVPQMQETLDAKLGHLLTAVTTGHGSIDLIIPGVHKAHGLRLLQDRWGIADEDVVAFGDSCNDLEMVKQAGYGVAMANAVDAVKAVAGYHAPHNNEEGVLEMIDKALKGEAPFTKR